MDRNNKTTDGSRGADGITSTDSVTELEKIADEFQPGKVLAGLTKPGVYDALTLAIAQQYGMDPDDVTDIHRQMARAGASAESRREARNIERGWSAKTRDAAGNLAAALIDMARNHEDLADLPTGTLLVARIRKDEDGTIHACMSASTPGTATPLHVGTLGERWLGTNAPSSVTDDPGRGVEKMKGRNAGAERVARPYVKRDEVAATE